MSDVLTPDRPVIGIRQWRLNEDGNLRGYSSLAEWTPGDNSAEPPKAGNMHVGLHAYSPASTDKMQSGWYYVDEALVTGVVIGWGNVCVHSLGWRAEHARIVALASFASHVEKWRSHYNLREESPEDVAAKYPGGEPAFTEMARRYGVQTVDSLSGSVEWARSEGLGVVLPPTAHKYVEYASAHKQAREWQLKADSLRLELEAGRDRATLLAPVPTA